MLARASFTVSQILAAEASVEFHVWSFSECLLDTIGNNERPKTLVYGPVETGFGVAQGLFCRVVLCRAMG